MEKLLTTKQIAELYGISDKTLTNNWCNKGLKFIKGKNYFLFKISWVEEFIEKQAHENSDKRCAPKMNVTINKTIKPRARTKFNYEEMKII